MSKAKETDFETLREAREVVHSLLRELRRTAEENRILESKVQGQRKTIFRLKLLLVLAFLLGVVAGLIGGMWL